MATRAPSVRCRDGSRHPATRQPHHAPGVDGAGQASAGAGAGRDNDTMCRRLWISLGAAGLAAAGCSPANDWRELHPEGATVSVQFPCKPDRQARQVRLAQRVVQLDLLACESQGVTYALAFADMADPVAVTPALDELRGAAIRNTQASDPRELPLAVPGMTPNPRAARLAFTGRRPDGTPVQEEAGFFVHGLRVYQATVLGPRLSGEATAAFFAGLRAGS